MGFAQGQSLSEHAVPQDALLFFANGEAELTLGKNTMIAQTGSWVHMEPNLPHSLTAKVPTTMLVIIFKSKK